MNIGRTQPRSSQKKKLWTYRSKANLHFDLAFSLRPRFHEIAAHAHPYSNLNSSTDNRCETLALAIIASSMPASTTRLKQHSLCSTVVSSASLIYMVSLVRSISNPHLQCRATTGLKCAFRASLFLACEPEPSGHLTTHWRSMIFEYQDRRIVAMVKSLAPRNLV